MSYMCVCVWTSLSTLGIFLRNNNLMACYLRISQISLQAISCQSFSSYMCLWTSMSNTLCMSFSLLLFLNYFLNTKGVLNLMWMWMCRLKFFSFEGVVEALHGSQFYLHRLFKRNPSFPRISGCIQQWELWPRWSLHWFVWHISCLSRSNRSPISPHTTVSFLTPTALNSFGKWKFVP